MSKPALIPSNDAIELAIRTILRLFQEGALVYRERRFVVAAAPTRRAVENLRGIRWKPRNTCNRHDDCATARAKAEARGVNVYAGFCCTDECCEECFGS